MSRRLLAEIIGTFFLVLIGPGAAMMNTWTHGGLGTVGIALAFAFVVIAIVGSLGHLSGAHINPAVTVGLWSLKKFPSRDVLPYILAQLLGAVAASFVLRSVLGDVGSMGATLPAVSSAGAFAIEFLLSFVLMLVILGSTDVKGTPGIAPIAIGVTVGFCAMVFGPLTGASMNPARSFGPALIGAQWHAHWIYWIAPIAGMLTAARAYRGIRHQIPEP